MYTYLYFSQILKLEEPVPQNKLFTNRYNINEISLCQKCNVWLQEKKSHLENSKKQILNFWPTDSFGCVESHIVTTYSLSNFEIRRDVDCVFHCE